MVIVKLRMWNKGGRIVYLSLGCGMKKPSQKRLSGFMRVRVHMYRVVRKDAS